MRIHALSRTHPSLGTATTCIPAEPGPRKTRGRAGTQTRGGWPTRIALRSTADPWIP